MFRYWTRSIDPTALPSGPDGKPDPAALAELLKQLNDELTASLAQARQDSYAWDQEQRVLTERIANLQKGEYRVLKRWLRRAAIIEARHDQWLRFAAILTGILSVGLPLCIVVISLAWRLATWAVAG